MRQPLKILLLEDSNTDVEIIKRLLLKEVIHFEMRLAMDKKGLLKALEEFSPEVILSDNSMPQFTGTEALKITRQRYPHLPFILVTGTVSEEFAASIISQGADDYILKDRMTRLPVAIKTAIKKHKSEKEKETTVAKLIESEEKYRALVERVSDGFIALDAEWRFIYVNNVAEEILKRTEDDLIGKNLWEEFPYAVDKPFYKAYHEAMKTQQNIYMEDYSEAAKKWIEARIYPSPTGLSVYFRDITEQRRAEEEARKSEEKYRVFIQRITDAFIALDKDWRYTYLNKQAGELIHRKPEDLIGKSVWDIFPDVVGSSTYKAFHKAMKEQQYVHNEDYYAPLDLWQENHIYPSKDGISVFIRDISQRKRAEENLLQSQKRFIQAQEIAHLGNWEVNFITGHSKWSDEAYRIYGFAPGDHNISIEQWLSFVHPDDKAYVKKIVDDATITLTNIAFHHRIITRDGIMKYVYSESKIEFDQDGQPIGLYGICLDETESKQSEAELKKSNERFQYATKASSDIIWELNFETKEYLVHEGKEKLFGPNRIIDWKLGVEGKYIVDEDREKVRQNFREARMDPSRILWECEYRVNSQDNSILYVINHAIFIRDNNGKVKRVIGAITDITERKKLEAELLEQQRLEQLKITARTLEAQEKERDAIGMELHDNVNQILVGTKLLLSIIKDVPEQARDIISNSMSNLQDAINENRKIAHELVAPDFNEKNLVEQISNMANNMLGPAGLELNIESKEFQEKNLSNQQKLAVYRIAQEQCTNIVKYAGAKMVTITMITKDSLFKMTVADNGKGMDTKKKAEGIGLKNINSRLSVFNGSSSIHSSPGKGFSLEIVMPVREGE